MCELELKDLAIVATDSKTGEAYCRVLSQSEALIIMAMIKDENEEVNFIKVHGFELRKKA